MTKKKNKKDVTLILTVNKNPKKDKRTKAELIKLLEVAEAHRDMLARHQSIKMLNDTAQYDAGYNAGVKEQIALEKNNKWWKFY